MNLENALQGVRCSRLRRPSSLWFLSDILGQMPGQSDLRRNLNAVLRVMNMMGSHWNQDPVKSTSLGAAMPMLCKIT